MLCTLRVLRVLRIIKRAEKLQIIFKTILVALPAMSSLGLLLLLLQFLFAIIGMEFFAFVKLRGELNYHANFQGFGAAFLLLMRCTTGEGWGDLMFDTARTHSLHFQCDPEADIHSILANGLVANGCGRPVFARVYFLFFQVIVSQVFLNLFIAIVVDTFIGVKLQYDLPINQADVDAFVTMWQQYDPLGTGYIAWRDLESLFIDLCESNTDFFSDDPE